MTLHEEQERVQQAVQRSLAHVQADPWLTQRVLAHAKGEKNMVKRISASMILAIALAILSMTAALAASIGLFGELAQKQQGDDRLMTLEKEAEMLSTSIKADDGITIEIGQAYYEGDRVFLSYRLTGNLFSSELHEGAPEESYQWSTEIENFIAAESFFNEVPELQRLNAWLDGKGQRWGISFEAMLHDGLMLEDGTYLDIYAGNNVVQEDGSVIGWKECKIPEEKLADTLTFKAVLYRGKSVEFQDGSTFRMYYDRGESTDIFFMLRRNDRFVYLKGAAETAVYQVQAEFIAGKVDLRGTIHLTSPAAWVRVWTSWDETKGCDTIINWNLYQKGQLVSKCGVQSITGKEPDSIDFDLLYARMNSLEDLTLVPEYSQTGEHPEEAIKIEQIIK